MPGHAPQRSCLGCRSVLAKEELLRFVLAPDRTLVPDLAARLPGRGSYTCPRESCLRAALAKRQFARSFRGEVLAPTPDDLVATVGRQIEERIGSYLALANKAGKVISGSDLVLEARIGVHRQFKGSAESTGTQAEVKLVKGGRKAGLPIVGGCGSIKVS